jgi:hypothetical protein
MGAALVLGPACGCALAKLDAARFSCTRIVEAENPRRSPTS